MIPLGILAAVGAGGGADTGAYELISTTILSSTSASITFSSIPNTYRHLQIRTVTNAGSGSSAQLKLNNSSGPFTDHSVEANGISVGSSASVNSNAYINAMVPGVSSNVFGPGITDILDYNSTVKYPVVRLLSGKSNDGSSDLIRLTSGFNPNSLTPVTSLVIGHPNSFNAGSRFSLYGIKG